MNGREIRVSLAPVRIGEAQVRHVARLARLELTPEEIERMVHDLDSILGYVELLESVATDDVPPTTHPLDIPTPLRPDRASDPLPVESAVAAAPASEAGAFLVPKVIE